MKTTSKATNTSIPPGRFPGRIGSAGRFLRRKAADGATTVAAARRCNARDVLILAAAALAAIGPALGARAQGSIDLDNSQSTGRVAINLPGTYYQGVYGLEVWELNADVVPPGINRTSPWVFTSAPGAYANMVSAGFRKEATFRDQSMYGGHIGFGELDMPAVAPAGANVVIALSVWDTVAPTASGALNAWDGGNVGAGVIAFVNPTANYTAFPTPAPPALSGWTSDLVMNVEIAPAPEPSAFALAVVGAAAWLSLRRHRNRR